MIRVRHHQPTLHNGDITFSPFSTPQSLSQPRLHLSSSSLCPAGHSCGQPVPWPAVFQSSRVISFSPQGVRLQHVSYLTPGFRITERYQTIVTILANDLRMEDCDILPRGLLDIVPNAFARLVVRGITLVGRL